MADQSDIALPAGTNDGLLRAVPASHGVDAGRVRAFLADVEADGLELHAFLLWRRGALVAEGCRWPYGPDRPRILHSITKSFTACAIGLLIEEGRLALQDRVAGFFPEIDLSDVPRLSGLTVEDLLTMRTGHGEEVSGSIWRGIKTSWIAEFFRIPVEHDPGTMHVYSSAASYMLSAIVTRITGETIHAYLKPRLFEPLGFRGETWDIGPDGFNPGGNGIGARMVDAIKLGILHARRGMWEGRQILPPWWVGQATRPQGAPDYGYHWVIGDGYFAALGVFVQAIFVYPEDDAVIAVSGAMEESKVLLPHLKRHFPAAFGTSGDAGADRALSERLAEWRTVPRFASRSRPATPLRESWWLAEANPVDIRRLRFEPGEGELRFILEDGAGPHAIALPFDRWQETRATLPGAALHHGYPLRDAPVIGGARWIAPDTLELVLHFVESAFRDRLAIRFDGDRLTLDRRVNINSGARAWPTLGATRL